jgi:hypothetical protein
MRKFAILVIAAALSWPIVFHGQTATPDSAAPVASIPPDQQPTKEQLAKLFEVMRLRKQMESMTAMIPQMVQQQFRTQMKQLTDNVAPGAKLTPDQQAQLDGIMTRYVQKATTIYTTDEMIADMTAIYQRHMSRDDVDSYIAFFNSAAGQHLLDSQPAIMKEYLPLVMQRQQAGSKELITAMEKEIEDFVMSLAPQKNPESSNPKPQPQQ